MPVGPFLSHDEGYAELLGADNWATGGYYAVLATDTEVPARDTQVDLDDILEECADVGYVRQDLASKAVALNSTKVRFTCAKINFGADVSLTARYLYILKGAVATAAGTDKIVGHIDLDGSGNVSSVSAEFSFTPDGTNGLFEIQRSELAA